MESVVPYIRSQSSRSMVTSQGFRFFRWNRAGAPSFMRWLSLILSFPCCISFSSAFRSGCFFLGIRFTPSVILYGLVLSIADPHLGSSSGIHGKRIFLPPHLDHLGKLSRVFMQASLVL